MYSLRNKGYLAYNSDEIYTIGFSVANGLVGIIPNLMVICLSAFRKNLRTGCNVFIANLALADIILLLNMVSLNVYNVRPKNSSLCILSGFITYTCACEKYLTLMLLSLNRYLKFYHDPIYRVLSTVQRSCLLSLISWVLSGLIMSPFFIYGLGGFERKELLICGFNLHKQRWAYSYYSTVMVGFLTGLLYPSLVFLNVRVWQQLNQRQQERSDNSIMKFCMANSRQMLRAVIIFISVPVVLQLPSIFSKLNVNLGLRHAWIARTLAMMFVSNAAFNPYVSLFLLRPYRLALKHTLSAKKPKKLDSNCQLTQMQLKSFTTITSSLRDSEPKCSEETHLLRSTSMCGGENLPQPTFAGMGEKTISCYNL